MKRLITKREEQIYRLSCFGHFSPSKVAKLAGITEGRVYQLLASVRKKAPQLFEKSSFIPRGKITRYDPSMDESVKEKF